MKKEEVIRLIVIDDSSNDAETVSNILRNAGHAVRADRVEDDEDLREALSGHGCDMVISKPELPFFSAVDALTVLNQMELAKHLPLLLLDDGKSEQMITAALHSGARDTINLEQPQRLVHTIMREWHDFQRTQRHTECEQLLLQANARAQALVDSSRDSIAYVHEGMHIYANESYLQTFGYTDLDEIEGMPLLNLVGIDDHGPFKEFLRDYARGRSEEDQLQVQGLRADGTTFKLIMEFAPANYDGEACTQIIIRDQSMSKELEQKLDNLSKQDLLTGVYNRQYLFEVLKQASGKPGSYGAVLYIEPDNYADIRNTFGIGASDLFLTDLASVINSQLRHEHDFVARLEGQTFTVVLHGMNIEQATAEAKQLLQAIEDHIYEINGQTVATTCSLGIALYSEALKEPQEVLQRADRALRRASDEGGNRIHAYNPAAEEMAEQERIGIWSQKVKQALRDNQFRLLFPPIVSLKGDGSENYEILLRMLDEDGKTIPPNEFIPAAEQSGLMNAIDRWVLMHAVKTLAERRRRGKKTNFFIKLSGDSVKDARLLPWLRDLMKASRLEANTLTLEVSETIASSNLKNLKLIAAGLRQLRIRLALDHYGRASNFLNLLKHLDADFLKISGQLINEIGDHKEAMDRINEITGHAQQEGKLTIAEYVEDAKTLALLYSSGVDYIQGHFLQQPGSEMDYDFSAM